MTEDTEPWRGCLRDGGRPVRDAVAMARGLRACCKRRDRAGRRYSASRSVVDHEFNITQIQFAPRSRGARGESM